MVRKDLVVGFGESAGSFPAQKEKHRLWSGASAILKLELPIALGGLGKCRLRDPIPRALHSIVVGRGLFLCDDDAVCAGIILGEPLD